MSGRGGRGRPGPSAHALLSSPPPRNRSNTHRCGRPWSSGSPSWCWLVSSLTDEAGLWAADFQPRPGSTAVQRWPPSLRTACHCSTAGPAAMPAALADVDDHPTVAPRPWTQQKERWPCSLYPLASLFQFSRHSFLPYFAKASVFSGLTNNSGPFSGWLERSRHQALAAEHPHAHFTASREEDRPATSRPAAHLR